MDNRMARPMSHDTEVFTPKQKNLVSHLIIETKLRWTYEPRAEHEEFLAHYNTMRNLKTLCLKTDAVSAGGLIVRSSRLPSSRARSQSSELLPIPTENAAITVPMPNWKSYISHFLSLVPTKVRIFVSNNEAIICRSGRLVRPSNYLKL